MDDAVNAERPRTRLLRHRRYQRVHELPGRVELDHAQDILADLMDTVVGSLRPAFRLAKLEGIATLRPLPEVEMAGRAREAESNPEATLRGSSGRYLDPAVDPGLARSSS